MFTKRWLNIAAIGWVALYTVCLVMWEGPLAIEWCSMIGSRGYFAAQLWYIKEISKDVIPFLAGVLAMVPIAAITWLLWPYAKK